MITEAELREHQYQQHRLTGRHAFGAPWLRPHATRLFQKWIRHDSGIKLFAINIFEYEAVPEAGIDLTYAPEARLYLPSSNGGGFDVCLHERLPSVPEVETFFMHCYVGLGCMPDPHNQDL